jgi:hypothetical protein
MSLHAQQFLATLALSILHDLVVLLLSENKSQEESGGGVGAKNRVQYERFYVKYGSYNSLGIRSFQ